MLGELVPLEGGDRIPLLKTRLRIGRHWSCDIVLRALDVSSQHAELKVVDEQWHVVDNGSKNGVRVNGTRVVDQRLESGDVVAFGKQKFKLLYPEPDPSETVVGHIEQERKGGDISSTLAGFLELVEDEKKPVAETRKQIAQTAPIMATASLSRSQLIVTICVATAVGFLVLLVLPILFFHLRASRSVPSVASLDEQGAFDLPASPTNKNLKPGETSSGAPGTKVDAASIKLGTWLTTGPLPSQGIRESLFPEKGVDLKATSGIGNPLWQELPDWTDGIPAKLPGDARSATYLYRIIDAKKPISLPAGISSDSGLVAWLNGQRVLWIDLTRGAGVTTQRVELDLIPGKNELLLKIQHGTDSPRFYFSADLPKARLRKPAAAEDQQVAKVEPARIPDVPAPATEPVKEPAVAEPPPVDTTAEVVGPMPSQPAGSDKLAVPARKSQDEMVRQFDEVYHFTQERTPAQKTELANRLFELGKKSQGGPVEKFVFFREAIELGTGGGAVDLVLQVVDAIAAEFNIDALDVKQKVMTGLAATTGDAAGVRSFIEHADALVDGALAESRYDLAVNLAQAAHDVSQKPAGKDLRRHTFERRSEVQQLAASWEQLRTVQSALKVNPEEPNANLQMGRWYCLKQGNWERGLAHLAKSADPTLRQLAAQELQSPPTDPAEQVKLADGWWAISDAAADADKIALRRHAGQWYLKAAPGLPEGFAKDKVVNRLAEIAKSEHAAAAVAPGVPAAAATPAPAGEKPAVSADTAKLGREVSIDLGGGVKMEFVLIPAGVFVMGDEKGKDHERPPHNVTLTRSFYLGKCEVSQEQWRAVMGNNPSKFDGLKNPVENVSWEDCQTFLKKLNEKFGKGSVKFSLPTEAEWEYSCRAGSTTRWCFGDDPAMIGNYAWFAENSAGKTQPVGQKKPNVWGLYDMHGNVVEWCADNYDKDYYRGSPPVDPPGPASSDWRVVRGGSFNFSADGQRSAWRGTGWPTDRFNDYGFRVLRVVTVP